MKDRVKAHALIGAAVAVLVFPTAALAQDVFDGFYGAVSGGVGVVKVEGTTLLGPISDEESIAIVGLAAGARTGIGNNSSFVVGVELDGNLYTDNSDWRYGISGLAGLKINDNSLLYFRIGYGKYDSDAVDLDALILGGGYEYAIDEQIGLRLDYKALLYDDEKFLDSSLDYDGYEITAAFVLHF